LQIHNSRPSILNVAVVTVCVERLATDQLLHAVDAMPWIVSSSSFDTYISASRRPSLGIDLRSVDACIAVVNFDINPTLAAETAIYLTQTIDSRLIVIALTKDTDPAMLLSAMRAGCSELLSAPLQPTAITQMLHRIAQVWLTSTMQGKPGGSVISLFGAKGGVGTTTLATHLAMYLVQCHGKKTLLIDNHPELGHVCIYLGIDGSRYHFHELVRNVPRLDSELLKGFVATHSSGLEILSSPDICGQSKTMDAALVTKTIEFLRGEYDYVILDCATPFDESNLAAVHLSEHVYLVATPDFGAIRDLSRCIDRLDQSDGVADKLKVVVNRLMPSQAIGADQIQKAVKLPVSIRIPEDLKELTQVMNLGKTLSIKSKSAFSAQIVKWSEKLAGTPHQVVVEGKEKKFFTMWHKTQLHPNA
jgi:pilus assembly protein CpaE